MPEPTIGQVPFNEAINHFRKKLKVPTHSWDDMLGEAHAKGFTVAGATKADVLSDLNNAIEKALTNGTTITDFRRDFDKTVQDNGWKYKGKRGWRTRVIYDTNLRTAHMAGKWEQFQRLKTARPFLQYQTAGDERVRPEHGAWNGIILSIDDAWWSTHYPPNGWGCRCTVRSLNQRQIDRDNLQVTNQAPALNPTERINPSTGEIYGDVPKGIDVGWDYNVGQSSLAPDIAFGEKLMSMPRQLRTAALKNTKDLIPHLEGTFTPWVDGLVDARKPRNEVKTVGYLSAGIIDKLAIKNHTPTTAVITVTDRDILHLIRDAKNDKKVPLDIVKKLPKFINNPNAILWDKNSPGLLYIFDVLGEDKKAKFVVKINYKSKSISTDGKRQTLSTNTLRTGGIVNVLNLKDKATYELLEGGL